MKREMAVIATGVALALGGCANTQKSTDGSRNVRGAPNVPPTDALNTRLTPPSTAASPSEVAATIHDQPITLAQVQKPLLQAYGLNVLLNLARLDLARQETAKAGLIVSPEEIQKEYDLWIGKLFGDTQSKIKAQLEEAEAKKDEKQAAELREDLRRENETLLDQFLTQRRISRPEFMLVIETDAYLRKLAERQMPTLTEKNLEDGWRAQYGEKVVVRHIQLTNMQEVAAAKAKLAAGEPFAEVAREMSTNTRTRALGGELPAFTMSNTNVPEAFKRAAFALKVGQVSEVVQAEGSYHLLQLVQRIAPKAVKFEDVKEAVRQELTDRWVQNRIDDLRKQLTTIVVRDMQIKNPVLRKEFDERIAQQNGTIKDREQIKREIERTREQHEAATRAIGGVDAHLLPATEPTTAPASRATTRPTQRIERDAMPEVHVQTTAPAAAQPEGLRPPATKPGAPTPAPGQPATQATELNK